MKSKALMEKVEGLAKQYRQLAEKQADVVREIAMAELPEMVYNSNAIENSTLTLSDTEDILLRDQIRTDHEVREIYEAKNLAKAVNFLWDNPTKRFSVDLILQLHKILLTDIYDSVAGRFRSGNEWVRVGAHIGANPAFVNELMYELVDNYNSKWSEGWLEKIAHFHAEFETIHPFLDGNGRIGRVLMNWQLEMLDLPPVIIPARTKFKDYYPLLDDYEHGHDLKPLIEVLTGLVFEALNRRIAHLTARKIVPVTEWAKQARVEERTASDQAAHHLIPAFREKENWLIDADFRG